jgi:hypothetical protein
MGRNLQLVRHFARADRYDPYNTVQFLIAASAVTGRSAPFGHSICRSTTACVLYRELTDEQEHLFWVTLFHFVFLIDTVLIIRPNINIRI